MSLQLLVCERACKRASIADECTPQCMQYYSILLFQYYSILLLFNIILYYYYSTLFYFVVVLYQSFMDVL